MVFLFNTHRRGLKLHLKAKTLDSSAKKKQTVCEKSNKNALFYIFYVLTKVLLVNKFSALNIM